MVRPIKLYQKIGTTLTFDPQVIEIIDSEYGYASKQINQRPNLKAYGDKQTVRLRES